MNTRDDNNFSMNCEQMSYFSKIPKIRDKRYRQLKANRCTQEGMALVISMLLLLATTIIGVTTLSSTLVNEKITGSTQQKAISFEAAETAIASSWGVSEFLESLELIPNGVFDNPEPVKPPGIADQLSVNLDQTNSFGRSVDIDIALTLQYCGEMLRPVGTAASADESKIQLAGILFDVNGRASIKGSNSQSDHVQRGYVVRPKTRREGACTIPGS